RGQAAPGLDGGRRGHGGDRLAMAGGAGDRSGGDRGGGDRGGGRGGGAGRPAAAGGARCVRGTAGHGPDDTPIGAPGWATLSRSTRQNAHTSQASASRGRQLGPGSSDRHDGRLTGSPRLAGLLPDGAVDPVEEVGERDFHGDRGQLPLVKAGRGLVPDLV